MIGSPWMTGILAHVPALGIPDGIEPSIPPDEASVAPEEEPEEDPEEDEPPAPPLLLPAAPLDEPLLAPELDPEPDPDPLPDPLALGAEPSFESPPLPDGQPGPEFELEPHEAFSVQPRRAMKPIETSPLALIETNLSTNRAERPAGRRLARFWNFWTRPRMTALGAEISRAESGEGPVGERSDLRGSVTPTGTLSRAIVTAIRAPVRNLRGGLERAGSSATRMRLRLIHSAAMRARTEVRVG